MAQYKVYQFKLTDHEVETINAGGLRDVLMMHHVAIHNFSEIGHHMKRFILVAEVEADSLEGVFGICNPPMPDDSRIVRHERMHSLSVGDLVADEGGQLWRCEPVGWLQLRHWSADDLDRNG